MTTTSTKVTVERQADALGALVTGVNLAHDLDDDTFQVIHQRSSTTT